MRTWIGKSIVAAGMAFGAALLAGQTPPLPAIAQPPPSVPYAWKSVVIRGGGFVPGILFHPARKGLVYARTDVGGAYRSDDSGAHWMPLNDQFGRDESSYLGIESIAIDPQNANKLYLAAGMYSADWGGPAAVLRSNDRGRTFARTAMPFKMGGNDNGRGCGERLAVDPHLGSVLFFGSRKAGLWKSSDSGLTWAHVDSFPVQARVAGVGQDTGIAFVLFDATKGIKGDPTQTIYAGVAAPGAGLYRSDDAGETWKLVPGAPPQLFPCHAAPDGMGALYFTYVDNVGPNGITNGAIWKLNTADGRWTDISPITPGAPGQGRFGYGGIAIDAEHPQTLMATTIDRWSPGDAIFRSIDGGKKWKEVGTSAIYAAPEVPWVYWHRDHTGGTGWMSDIKIDPFDSSRVMYTTGEGIWGSADVTAMDAGRPTHWSFPDEGFEETVPLAIVSPPQGAHLLSGVGDIGGFRHDDLQASPKNGFFIDPSLTTNTSLDFAALAPAIVVRVGHGDPKLVHGGYSLDGGDHWKPFASEVPGSRRGGGHIVISADGRTIVWEPDQGEPLWSADWGRSWAECRGLAASMAIASDRVNPAKFYAFDPATGQFLQSTDGARSFTQRTAPVAAKGRSAVLAATPGVEGDLWIGAGDRVYHTADSGASFAVLDGMMKVSTIGFGMAAPGRQKPAIYMDGVAAGQEGIYRSDDSGDSWVRVDDDRHQFGWKNAITGDPRVYGRLYLATGGRGIVYGERQ